MTRQDGHQQMGGRTGPVVTEPDRPGLATCLLDEVEEGDNAALRLTTTANGVS